MKKARILKRRHKVRKMSKVFVASLLIASFILGFFSGRVNVNNVGKLQPMPQDQEVQNALNAKSPLFKSQTATFQGKITSVAGSSLQVESDTGQVGEFEVSDKVIIYKFPSNSPTASASSDLKTIEEDKQVLIMLELMDGKYKVVSISYFRQAQ